MAIAKKTQNGKTLYQARISYKAYDNTYKKKSSKWFSTRKEAQNWIIANQENVSDLTVTFYKAFCSWLNEADRHNDKAKTKLDKKRYITTYLEPLFDKKIEKITVKDILSVLSKNERFQALGTERKNRVLLWGGSIFRHSKIHFNTTNNPFEQISRFKKTDAENMKEYNIYTPEQFEQFVHLIDPKHKQYADFFTILFYSGCRLNEIRSLTFSRVYGNQIKIDRQLDQSGDGFTTVKTRAGNRTVALPKRCINLIQEQRQQYQDLPGFSAEWFVFGGYKPLAIRTIQRVKNDTIKEHGLVPIRIHDLRHSHASYLIEQGVNIYKISKRLGHTSISITLDRYGHLLDRDEDEILAVL